MPNWCSNVAYIKHDDVKELEKIVTELEKGDESGLFNLLVPNPSGEWQYDWSVANWGTKWDASVHQFWMEPEHLCISFDTAWAPPIDFYNKIGELGYEVEAFYHEPGMCFAGHYLNGDDDEYNLSNATADEAKEMLPTSLDEMFGISESMREYEEEEKENG